MGAFLIGYAVCARPGGGSASLGNAGGMDIAQLPGDKNAHKQRNGQTHAQAERVGHFLGLVRGRLPAAQHEEQRSA